VIALLLGGCLTLPDLTDCTNEAVISVRVWPVDAAGDPIPEPEVAWRQVGDASWQPCEDWSDGSHACGFEVAGELEVRADGWGFDALTQPVTVTEDECHPITEDLTLTLETVGCTGEVVPSAIVTVVDTDGSPVTTAEVVYEPVALDVQESTPCDAVSDHVFHCGEELPGEVWVEASAPNRGSWSVIVDVAQTECHVITEEVTAELMVLD